MSIISSLHQSPLQKPQPYQPEFWLKAQYLQTCRKGLLWVTCRNTGFWTIHFLISETIKKICNCLSKYLLKISAQIQSGKLCKMVISSELIKTSVLVSHGPNLCIYTTVLRWTFQSKVKRWVPNYH